MELHSHISYILLYIVFLNLLFFFYFWLHTVFVFFSFSLRLVFVAALGLSLVEASGGHSSLQCTGFSLRWLLLLRSTGSRHAGSVVVVHGFHRSAACGIFPDQGSNPCLLHWQADSQPLRHQGSPAISFFVDVLCTLRTNSQCCFLVSACEKLYYPHNCND